MSYVLALWTAVALGAVLGRIIEKEPEVIEQSPSLRREQASEWSREFYRPPGFFSTSQLESVNEGPEEETSHYIVEPLSGSGNGHNRQDRRMSNFATVGFNTYERVVRGESRASRLNSRHFDVSAVNYPSSGKKPAVRADNLEWMLKHIFMYPRSHATNQTAKNYVKKYITDSFQYTSGLRTTIQHFEPIQFLNMYDNGQVPTGVNIIGVIRGTEWGSPLDRPVVIGAHWDTVNFTPGTDDNGSGVAAMLEAARAIAHSECRPKYTIIFVAFDLEEVGSQGSLIFIKEYLMKVLQTNFPKEVGMAKFQGAFIMDTIMNFNESDYSQTFPTDWSLVVPDVYDQVADNKYKGDFLSMIYRRDVDNRLAEKFHFHWGKSKGEQKFKLQPFPLMLTADLPELEILADHLNFLRSDHARFWYMNDSAVPHTLSAVLMTDSGPYRGNMRNCYHTVCDGPEVSLYASPENIKFLTKITQVLTDTVVDMSECKLVDSQVETISNNVYLSTSNVNLKNSSPRGLVGSPLRHLMNFIKWMQRMPAPTAAAAAAS